MTRAEHNANYEARLKARGFVRGPRITAEAAEALRSLAFATKRAPSEVVSRLLVEAAQTDSRVRTAMRVHGLSVAEARHVVESGLDQ